MKKEINIQVITKLDEKFIAEWQELWRHAENASVFNSYSWFLSCIETGFVTDYEIYAYYKEAKLCVVLPLQKYKKFGISVVGTICNRFLVDTALLAEKYDNRSLNTFFQFISTKRNIYLQKLDAQLVALLHKQFPEFFFTLLSVNPTVTIAENPFLSVSSSTVSQIKKIIRKNPGQFRFEFFDGNIDLEKHLQIMFDLEQHSAKKLRSMDIFSNPQTKNFFTQISKNCKDLVRIGFLYYNDEPIAYQYGFLYGTTFVAYQTAYLHDYAKLRPGKTMLFHLLEKLKELGVTMLDLGGGISMYKQEFTQDYRLLYDLYYSKNSATLTWWKVVNNARRRKQLLFPKKNTRDHEFLFTPLS